jgi:hypothetical protein
MAKLPIPRIERHATYQTAYTRTPFGRETAERLARRGEP